MGGCSQGRYSNIFITRVATESNVDTVVVDFAASAAANTSLSRASHAANTSSLPSSETHKLVADALVVLLALENKFEAEKTAG